MNAILVALATVGAVSLISFFAWLAKAIMDIRECAVRMEMNVASLLKTRETQAAEDDAETARRLNGLERKRK